MTIQCHGCGRYLAFADLCFSKHHYIPLNEFGPEESWFDCPACRDDYGGRDSDQSRNGRDAQRLDAKHAGAGRNGIAQPLPEPSHD